MNKSFVALLALLALAAPTSAAGVTLDASAQLPTGESHTLYVSVADDGSYVVLLDGQPVDPSTLGIPGLPSTPGVPTLPTPAAPDLPAAPGVPAVPGLPIPALPTLP